MRRVRVVVRRGFRGKRYIERAVFFFGPQSQWSKPLYSTLLLLPRCGVMIETFPLPFAAPAPPPFRGCSGTSISFGECPMASCHPNDGMTSHHPPSPSCHSSQCWLPSDEFPYLCNRPSG